MDREATKKEARVLRMPLPPDPPSPAISLSPFLPPPPFALSSNLG